MSRVGVYIHIPFCARKCPYCDFYSLPGSSELYEQYAAAVLQSMEPYREMGLVADTVYFGGGTPILPDAELLCRILDGIRSVFSVTEDAEITLEANPCVTTFKKLVALKGAGFNRISFGMQSADETELRYLGRLHTADQAKQAVLLAREVGFENLSVDLMLGVPGQTKESLSRTLQFMEGMQTDHVSAYLLKIEEGTAFDSDAIRALLPGEDDLCDNYLDTVSRLKQMGFLQYEISNFAKPGRESRHNLKYWNCEEYLGFGPSAHSYFGGRRFYYDRDLSAFLDPLRRKVLSETDTVDQQEEYLMMRLRLTEGVSLDELNRRFGIDPQGLINRCRRYLNGGLMELHGEFLAFTPQGFLVSNSILAELI